MARTDENTNPEPTTNDAAVSTDRPGYFGRLFADRSAIVSTLSTLVSVLLVGVIVATIVVGYRPLKLRTSHVKAMPVSVSFDWPPLAGAQANTPAKPGDSPRTWVNAEVRADLEKVAMGLLSDDPMDSASLTRTREALLGTGWFNDDLTLMRDERNAVRVRGSWKIPIAAVRTNGMDQLVSAKGELLPPRYKPDASGMKVVVGVKNDPPKLGEPWLGGDVQAGLKLLEFLAALPCFDQVAGVDVSEFCPDRKLTIITDLGNRILWGGAPDEFNPGQASPQTKLGRLAQLRREHGRIDAGRAMIDIRLTDGIYVVDTVGVLNTPAADQGKGDSVAAKAASKSKKTTPAAPQQARGNTHRR